MICTISMIAGHFIQMIILFFISVHGIYKYPLLIEKENINGVDYYQTKGKKLNFDFENVYFDLGNIFSGDPNIGNSLSVMENFISDGTILGKQINKLLTENWKMLLEEFGPTISEIVTNIITDIFNRIAKDVPATNVFLPD